MIRQRRCLMINRMLMKLIAVDITDDSVDPLRGSHVARYMSRQPCIQHIILEPHTFEYVGFCCGRHWFRVSSTEHNDRHIYGWTDSGIFLLKLKISR